MTDRPGVPVGRAVRTVQSVQPLEKSDDAYRTISEVAADLDLPQHVLRFWETRFPQVKPLKRAGGRRFYRPEDVALLRAVRVLLYDEGYTIKGVQRLLAEHGARHVADALARARMAAPPTHRKAPDGAGQDGSDRGERGIAAMPRQDHPVRPEPVVAPPIPAGMQSPETPAAPAAVAPAVGDADITGRMSAVLEDLAECALLLASVRST